MKKTLAMLFAAFIVSALSLTVAYASDDGVLDLAGKAIQDGYIGEANQASLMSLTLDDTQTASLKASIIAAWDSYSEKIDISEYNILKEDVEELHSLYTTVLNNNPEYFYVKGSFSYSFNAAGILTSIKINYLFDAEETESRRALFNSAVSEAMAVLDDSMTEIDKVIALHDYLVLNAEYDYDTYVNNNNNHPTSFSAYGVLVEKTGVCQSYTLAYNLLLNKCGIATSTVESRELNHVWSIVSLGDSWYHVDVTYDDPLTDRKGIVTYSYLMASDNEFMADGSLHKADDWVYSYTANSDLYKNAFWKSASSNMALLDGYYYYSYSKSLSVKVLSRSSLSDIEKRETLREVSGNSWNFEKADGTGTGNVSGGQFYMVTFKHGGRIYYNTVGKIYRYCPGFDDDEIVYDNGNTIGFIRPLQIKSDGTLDFCEVTPIQLNAGEFKFDYTYSSSSNVSITGGHNYSPKTVPATDTEYGYTEHKCTTCNDSYRDTYVNPLKYLPGDVNGDGGISSSDSVVLARYIANWKGYDSLVLAFNCDVNGDGKITSIDTVILSRHIANWKGYETLPVIG